MNYSTRSILNSRWLRLAIMAALLMGLVVAPRPRASALATTWYVSPGGNDGNSCTSADAPCQHINAAIGKSAPGDTIILAAGTYLENITIAKSLTLQGAGSDVTIIDGDELGSVASIFTESTPINVNLSGITFQHGLAGTGGGIYHSDNYGTLSISNSRIFSNTAQTGGGGIFNQGYLGLTNVSVDHNINSGTQRGGGILSLGFSDLINVTVANNQAQGGGGGIGNSGVMTLTNSFIGGANRAGQGGGAYNYGAGKLTLNDTTIIGNQATAGQGGGLYNEGGQVIASGITIINNQAQGGGGGLYSTNLGLAIGQLSISSGSIQNNVTQASGGGLDNESNATLAGVIIAGNHATVGGGGLYNGAAAQLTASATTIQNNTAQTAPGGGVFNLGSATLSGCPIVNNEATAGGGGGIENGVNAQLTLNDSGITGNRALNSLGGGLHNYAAADLTRVTIQNNSANGGGGLHNESTGRTTVNTSVIISNTSNSNGGGINNQGALTVTQSSIVSNTSVLLQGGGLFNKANAQLTNVTISNNSSPAVSDSGGAIYNDSGGILQAWHATISHNRAPGIVNNAGSVTLINTIAALSSGGSGANCSGAIIANGHNLDSGTSCLFLGGGNINNTDPQLGPLQDNGGGTLTRILLISSPAVDAADDAVCASIDQRNIARPQGDHCDIGAYEVIGFTNATGQNILANQCITSTLHVSSSFAIGSLLAGTNITFTPRGDLRINLYAPFGTPTSLLGGTGGSGANLNILWDTSSVNGVVTSTDHTVMFPFYYYVHQPAQSLASLFGRSVRGDWRLEICNLGSSTGRLNRWSLIIPDIKNFKAYLPVMRRK